MTPKKNIVFIINPISGGINKSIFPSHIAKSIDKNKYNIEIHFTTSALHNIELAKQAAENKSDVIVAVGGDGTINNIAKHVCGTQSIFGMIPMGSGNGLARHLKIPLNTTHALDIINRLKITPIDTGMINDQFFINLTGIGFDAHVSWMFANAPKRGFWSYAKITLKEFANYEPVNCEILIDGDQINEKAFLACIANGSQYGNNAYIAPAADLADGLFEITILKPFRKRNMPFIGLDLFNKKLNHSKFVKTYRGKHIVIKRNKEDVVNIDGEPVMMGKELDIQIQPRSLKIIIP